jgi:uncharacterized protein (TIGR02453 family)
MITAQILDFLQDLKKNNNRDWFHSQKSRYNQCRDGFLHFTEILIHEISQFDPSIKGQLPKDCVFRINRDIRFSKDKSPYKTNMGAFITPGGRNGGLAGYYLHLEPGASMIAGGIYMPPSPVLKTIRQEIHDNLEEFEEILKDNTFIQYFGTELWGEKLKTKPKGFDENFRGLEYLKYKHYTVSNNKTDNEIVSENLVNDVIAVFKAMHPFNRFINNAINEHQ